MKKETGINSPRLNSPRLNKIIMNKTLWSWLTPIGLAVITFMTYLPSLHYAFQFDDDPSILSFYNIRHKTFSDLFFTSARWVSCWLNTIHYKLGQFEPLAYRRTNVVFHCLTGILVYIFIILLLKLRPKKSFLHTYSSWIAGITSALFLLHPVQTQTVSYVIQGQLEGLSAFFCLAILICFTIFATTKNFLNKLLLTLTIPLLCLIACGTKEITIVLPFLTLLIDWFFIAQGNWQSLKKRLWMHALIAITIWGCYLWLLGKNFFIAVLGLRIEHNATPGNIITEFANQKITPWPFFISQFKVVLHYLFMFLWPFSICVDYDWKLCTNIACSDCLLPLFMLISIMATVLWSLIKNKTNLYAFGILWFFICMAPRSTIMPSTELLADYKTYLASIGWLFFLSLLLFTVYRWLSNNYSWCKNKITIAIFCASGITLLSFLTYQRNLIWKSGIAFWHDIVQKSPNKARGYNNYGVNLLRKDDVKNAVWCFKHAIQLEPMTYADAYNNLSAAYAVQQKLDMAIKALRASLKINPYQPKSYNNLGFYLLQKSEYVWAEKSFRQAISFIPHYGKAYHNLGKTYAAQNKLEEAWDCFKKACTQADGDTDPEMVNTYAKISMELRHYPDAINGYKMLTNLKQNDLDIITQLANAYLLAKDYDQAIQIYQSVIDKDPRNAKALGNLVEAYVMNKQPERGLQLIEQLEKQLINPPGLAIQKARALHATGKSLKAQLILYDYINRVTNAQLRALANQVLKEIEK